MPTLAPKIRVPDNRCTNVVIRFRVLGGSPKLWRTFQLTDKRLLLPKIWQYCEFLSLATLHYISYPPAIVKLAVSQKWHFHYEQIHHIAPGFLGVCLLRVGTHQRCMYPHPFWSYTGYHQFLLVHQAFLLHSQSSNKIIDIVYYIYICA